MILLLTAHQRVFQQTESLRQLHALAAAPFVDRLIAFAPPGTRAAAAKAVAESSFVDRVEVMDETEIRRNVGPHDRPRQGA